MNWKKPQPVFNVLVWDFNSDSLRSYNIIPYLIDCYEKSKPKPQTQDEFKTFILDNSKYRYWSRCEYEIIVTGWPKSKNEEKIDVHYQIENNLDIIVDILFKYIND